MKDLEKFYESLVKNIGVTLFCGESRSPFTQNSIELMTKFLAPKTSTSSGENFCPQDEVLFESIVRDAIIPLLYSTKTECRVNACTFIRRLMSQLEDVNDSLYVEMRKHLIERSADKHSVVRASSVKALHRFQDLTQVNDIVMIALKFHLRCDPDADVRLACVQTMTPCKSTLTDFIHATRDVNDYIRKTGIFLSILVANKLLCKQNLNFMQSFILMLKKLFLISLIFL